MAESSGKQRPSGRPFQKGQSGNAGGRPKGYSAFRKAFREETDIKLVRDALRGMIQDPNHKDHFNSAKLWFEYAYGKAPSAPDDNDAVRESGRPLAGASSDEILEALKASRA